MRPSALGKGEGPSKEKCGMKHPSDCSDIREAAGQRSQTCVPPSCPLAGSFAGDGIRPDGQGRAKITMGLGAGRQHTPGSCLGSYTHGHRKDVASQSEGSDGTPRGGMPGSLRCVHVLQETQKFLRVLVKETKVQRGLRYSRGLGQKEEAFPGRTSMTSSHDRGSKH